MKEIRDSRLYRKQHSTFESYCRERWGFARQTAYQYIGAAEVAENVRNCGQIPATESQARELARVKDEEERREVWREVTETHEPQEITAKVIRDSLSSRADCHTGRR